MGLERPLLSRDGWMATGLLSAVVACGFGGMVLAKHFHHPDTTVEAASSALPETTRGADLTPAPIAAAPGRGKSAAMPTPAAAIEAKPDPDGVVAAPNRRLPSPDASAEATLPPDQAAGAIEPTTANPSADVHSPGYVTEDEEIGLVLKRWRRALLSNDADAVAPSYSSRIDRYFLQSNVNRAYVREYMETQEETGSRLASYDLRDVSIDNVNDDEVDVRFVAEFRVVSPWRQRDGGTRTLLKLRREDGDWKIFYERDFNS